MSLSSLITSGRVSAEETIENKEINNLRIEKLLSRLSKLEQEVFKLYISDMPYSEIVDELSKIFKTKEYDKKAVDNALQRIRSKAQELAETMEFD